MINVARTIAFFLAPGIVLFCHASFAINADLAKKCQKMMVTAYPVEPAGSKTGNAAAQRAYFRECVAKNGNMPDGHEDEKDQNRK